MGNRAVSTSNCTILLLGCIVTLFILFHWQPHSVLLSTASTPAATMTLVHTVLFQFKADANPDDVKAACARFIGLQEHCIHPTSATPYILSMKGGQDNSPEGLQNGITHGFVLEFASVEDRDYYVDTDPAHQKFKESLSGLVDKAIVVDFTHGAY